LSEEGGAAAGGAIGSAFIAIRPEMSEFSTGLQGGIQKALGMIPGPVAAIAGTVAVVGGSILAIGEHFEGAYNKIAVGTGAVGGQLKTLEGDFRNVLGNTSGNFDQVSSAVTTLYQRTGLTGKALDDFAAKEVMLGKITKTDVGENTQATTELFNKFGIAAGQQSTKLDELFKASQIGGKGIQALSGDMKSGGVALRAVGFDFEHSAALIANLEKAGINVGPTLAAMKKSLAEFAKEGKDPQKAFEDITTSIKNAKTPTEALALSIKTFGTRAGPELVAAIRSGKFEVGALVKQIASGKDGIMDTAEHVSTLGEKFELLKNKALVAIEPIATKVVGLANDAFGRLLEVLGDLWGKAHVIADAFKGAFSDGDVTTSATKLVGIAERLGVAFRGVWEKARDVKDAFLGAFKDGDVTTSANKLVGIAERIGAGLKIVWDTTVSVVNALREGFSADGALPGAQGVWATIEKVGGALRDVGEWVEAHLKPILIGLGLVILDLVAPWASIAVVLIYAYTHFQVFREVVNAVASFLVNTVVPIVGEFVGAVVDGVRSIVEYAQNTFPKLAEAIGHVMAVLKVLVIPVLAVLYAAWYLFGQHIWDVVKVIFGLVVDLIKHAMAILGDVINLVLDLINGDWGKAWNDIKDIFAQLWGEIVDVLKAAVRVLWDVFQEALKLIWAALVTGFDATVDFFKALPGRILDALASLAGLLFGLWITVNTGILDLIATAFDAAVSFFKALPGRMLDGIGDLAGILSRFFWAALQWTIQQVINGIALLIQSFFEVPYRIVKMIGDLAGILWAFIGAAWDWVANNWRAALTRVVEFYLGLPGRIVGAIGDLAGILWGFIGAAWSWVSGNISAGLTVVVGFFEALPGRWVRGMGNIASVLWAAIGAAWGWVSDHVRSAVDDLVGFFTGLPDRFAKAAGDVFGFLRDSFKNAINWIIRGWNGLHFKIPEVDTHIPGVGKVGGDDIQVPQIPLLAKGGLFRGLALVGERGPELVNVGSTSRVFPNEALMDALGRIGQNGPAVQVQVDNHGGPPMTSAELVQRLRGVELLYKSRRG
jgi:phage-related minor tail protein